MEKTDMAIYAQSDRYFMEQIGQYIRQQRMQQRKPQHQIAKEAGLNRTTLIQLEKGQGTSLISLIQVLRALNKLDVLSIFSQMTEQVSPLELAKQAHKNIKYRIRTSADSDNYGELKEISTTPLRGKDIINKVSGYKKGRLDNPDW